MESSDTSSRNVRDLNEYYKPELVVRHGGSGGSSRGGRSGASQPTRPSAAGYRGDAAAGSRFKSQLTRPLRILDIPHTGTVYVVMSSNGFGLAFFVLPLPPGMARQSRVFKSHFDTFGGVMVAGGGVCYAKAILGIDRHVGVVGGRAQYRN